MANGRRREHRIALICQAALVWGLNGVDVQEFVRCGSIGKCSAKPLDPQLRAEVDRKIDEYMATGKLVIN